MENLMISVFIFGILAGLFLYKPLEKLFERAGRALGRQLAESIKENMEKIQAEQNLNKDE